MQHQECDPRADEHDVTQSVYPDPLILIDLGVLFREPCRHQVHLGLRLFHGHGGFQPPQDL